MIIAAYFVVLHVSVFYGSIVINQAKRYEGFDATSEFIPVSCATNKKLYDALVKEKPVIHKFGE